MLRIGSLFSGAGGLDMAVEAAVDGQVVWQSEINEAACTVLDARFPDVPNLGDITYVDWDLVRKGMPIEVLCGGFPCQDVSTAGKRAGIREGTRSGLWAMFADAIEALRPRIVVIENVKGLLSADGEPWPPEVQAAHQQAEWRTAALRAMSGTDMWKGSEYGRRRHARLVRSRERALARFRAIRLRSVQRAIGTVVGTLADLGYDAQWTTVSAASVGAPHKRERVFIVATDTQRERLDREADDARTRQSDSARGDLRVQPGRREEAALDHLLPTPAASRSGRNQSPSPGAAVRPSLDMITALLPTPTTQDAANCAGPSQFDRNSSGAKRSVPLTDLPILLPTPAAADGERGQDYARAGRDGSGGDDLITAAVKAHNASAWGKYAPAIEQWETVTRPAPEPTEPNSKGNPRLNPAFSEWMQGWPLGWVTVFVAMGLISRNDALRLIGNGVCPQQAHAAILTLLRVCEVAA